MMKTLTVFLCLVTIGFKSISQKNFVPGYIIKNNGDSIHGLLQEEIKKELLNQVKFSASPNAAAIVYTPDLIRTFGYDGRDTYKSISFSASLGDSSFSKTCFARYLVSGYYDLYAYTENEATYFVIRQGDSTYFLYNTTYSAIGSEKDKGNYQEKIRILSAACFTLTYTSDRVVYAEKDMAHFFQDVNRCMLPEKQVTNYYHNPKVNWDVVAFAGGLPLGEQSQLAADLALRLYYPEINKKAFLRVGMHFSNKLSTSEMVSGANVKYELDTRHLIISFPVTFQYYFTKGILQPYLNFGLSIAYMEKTEYKSPESEQDFSEAWHGSIVAAAGLEVHFTPRFFLNAEWRYELILQYPVIGLSYKFR